MSMTPLDDSTPDVIQYAKQGGPLAQPLSGPGKRGLHAVQGSSGGSPGSSSHPKCGSAWHDFYRDRVGSPGYRRYVASAYRRFIDTIVNEIATLNKGEHVVALEVACGLGTVTHILEHRTRIRQGYRPTFIATDNDPWMLEHASKALGQRARVVRSDMRECTWIKADVIHSHGSLEHLSDHDIYRTLEAHQKSGAKVAIHYVPGDGWGKPSFGDERLMPLFWWEDKWDTTEAHAFNDGKDYVLIWRF